MWDSTPQGSVAPLSIHPSLTTQRLRKAWCLFSKWSAASPTNDPTAPTLRPIYTRSCLRVTTWLCTNTRIIQESFVIRRLGPVLQREGRSSIPGIGWTILRGVNPKWPDRNLSQWHSVDRMPHELAWHWTLASAMWRLRLTVWTTARPLAHRAHLFVRLIPVPRREQFVNSINHPVFSDWYDEFSWMYAINVYILHGLPAGHAVVQLVEALR